MEREFITKADMAYLSSDEAKLMNVILLAAETGLKDRGKVIFTKDRIDFLHGIAGLKENTVSVHQVFAVTKIYLASRNLLKKVDVQINESGKVVTIDAPRRAKGSNLSKKRALKNGS